MQELKSLIDHKGPVRSVEFSPDGRLLASASDDQTIRLWELQTGWKSSLVAHRKSVSQVTFSSDGERLLSAARDGLIKVWNVTDLNSVQESLSLDTGQVALSVAISPDGTQIASGSYHTITLWDAKSGLRLNSFIAHPSWVHAVKFSPDGQRIATCGEDSQIRLWDQAGKEIVTLAGHSRSCRSIDFSPDGRRLASVSLDGTLKLWDARSFQQAVTFRGHAGSVVSLAFDPQTQRLASASLDHTVKLWNASTGQEIKSLTGHAGWVQCVAFHPDGTQLVSGSHDTTIRLWDSQSGEEIRVYHGHTAGVRCVVFRRDGKQMASAGNDKTIKLWDVESGKEEMTLNGHADQIRALAISPDGTQIASGSEDQTVKLWDTHSGVERVAFTGHQQGIQWLAFSPDGSVLASASNDHNIKLWDVKTGQENATLTGHLMGVSWVAFSPDGRRLASTGWDHTLKMWDPQTGREVATIEDRHESLQCGLCTPDGTQLAAAGGDAAIRLWTSQSHEEVKTLTGHTAFVNRVAFSLDGKLIYSESVNEKLIWDVATGMPLKNAKWEPPAERERVSPDGRWFVTSELNNVLLVDRDFKTTPREKNYRAGKAQFDSAWHSEQAAAAIAAKNWFAATFHFSWLVKHNPEQVSFQRGLQSSFAELQSQSKKEGLEIAPQIAMAVQEAVRQLPGDERANPGFEVPRIRIRAFEFHRNIPGWTTTSDQFEIWSTGFLGVDAFDGDQFVELNAMEEGTLFQDRADIAGDAVIEFSFAHRGRNGDDTLKLTITDLGADNAEGGGDDQMLFAKEFTTGKDAWAVYKSTTEPTIKAIGNKVRFAYTAIRATGGKGPDNTEGNFLDSAEFGVGVVTGEH